MWWYDGLAEAAGASAGTITGAGDAALPFAGAAAGVLEIEGAGSGALPFGGSAAGKILIQGLGNAVLPFAFSGAGAVEIGGTGTGALPFGGSATGTIIIQGIGNAALPFVGTGTLGIPGLPIVYPAGGFVPGLGKRNKTARGKERIIEDRPLPTKEELREEEPVVFIRAVGNAALPFSGSGKIKILINRADDDMAAMLLLGFHLRH